MLAASYREDLYPSDLFLLPWGQSLFLSNLKGLSQLNSERHLISKQHLSLFISKYRRKTPKIQETPADRPWHQPLQYPQGAFGTDIPSILFSSALMNIFYLFQSSVPAAEPEQCPGHL